MLRRRIAVLLAAVLLLAAAVPALAYETKTATLHYSGITIKLDGVYLTPRDVTGAAVDPFIIDGTTYLPIRAVASALGLDVGWEQETQTIRLTSGGEATLGEPGSSVPVVPEGAVLYSAEAVLKYPGITIPLDGETLVPKDVTGKVVDPFVIDGTTYLPIRAVASALGLGVDWDGATRTVLLYTDPQQGPSEPHQQETPEVDASILGELTGGGYVNAYFGIRFTPPEGWVLADEAALAEGAALLSESGSGGFVLAQAGLLSQLTLSVGIPTGLADLPKDPASFYPALTELLKSEEDGMSLANFTGIENVELYVDMAKFAGQDAVIVRIEAPLEFDGVDLDLTVFNGMVFLWHEPYLMMIQVMDIDSARFDTILDAFEAVSGT